MGRGLGMLGHTKFIQDGHKLFHWIFGGIVDMDIEVTAYQNSILSERDCLEKLGKL